MVTGRFPFDDRDKKHLLRQTLTGNIDYHSRANTLSEQVKDLIQKMLAADVSSRITLEEALEHPWMKRKGSKLRVPPSWRKQSRSISLNEDSSELENLF